MTRVRRDANAELLTELIGERFNDCVDLIRHACQRRNDWKAFYGVASAAEAYARGDADVRLHLMFDSRSNPTVVGEGVVKINDANAVRRELMQLPDLCIRMQRHPSLDPRPGASGTHNVPAYRSHDQNSDEAMLVGVVQLIKKNKGAVQIPVPSLIWLKRLDSCPEIAGDTLQTSPLFALAGLERGVGSVPDLLGVVPVETDGEAGAEEGVVGPREGKLPRETIERRAEIVRNLPDYDAPLIGQRGRPAPGAHIVVASFSVELGFEDIIGISFKEPLDGIVQGYYLALCPLDLDSWPIQTMHEVYSYHEQRDRRTQTEDPEGRAIPSRDAP